MKTIEDLAKEAAKHIRTEHGLQLSDFIATEFARRLFALRDAEAVPAWWHYEINGNWDGFSREMPDDDACDKGTIVALYEHAPIPSDLQAENERLKAEVERLLELGSGESFMKLRQQLAEANKERALVRRKLKLPEDTGFLTGENTLAGKMHVVCANAHGYEAYIETEKCDDKSGLIARLTVQLAESQSENERLAELCRDHAAQQETDAEIIKADGKEIHYLRQQLAESQARENKLREALEYYSYQSIQHGTANTAAKALDLPFDDTALREYVEREVAVMKAYYEQVLQDGGKRIADLQAENERLKADRDSWKITAEQHKENYDIINGDLRMKLADSQAELAALKQQEPFGEVTETGVVWANKNPHAYPVGTKFYTAPATDYKPIAERLLAEASKAAEQIRRCDYTPARSTLLVVITAAKAAGLGEE